MARIEATRRRVRCTTCGGTIAVGEPRVSDRYDPSAAQGVHLHHLDCAIGADPDLVSRALASPIEPGVAIDRADITRKLALSRETHQKFRRDAYAALLVPEDSHPPEPPVDTRDRALVEQLEADPDDPTVLAVLGDVLQSRGDPRGELISVQLALAGEGGTLDRTPLLRRRDELMMQLSPTVENTERCVWGVGFVRRVELVVHSGVRLASVGALWRHPSMRFVRELDVDLAIPYEPDALASALAGVRANLRWLALRANQSIRPISKLVGALPRLASLTLGERADFDELAHPALHRLSLYSTGPSQLAGAIANLSTARLPALRELVLDGTWGATHAVCTALQAGGWLSCLTHLALIHGDLDDRGITVLAAGLDGRKLARLDVTGNEMPMTYRARLSRLCDELVFPDQRAPDGPVFVEHANKPEWGRGTLVRRYDDKVEVDFPNAGKKVFKADAPFLKLD